MSFTAEYVRLSSNGAAAKRCSGADFQISLSATPTVNLGINRMPSSLYVAKVVRPHRAPTGGLHLVGPHSRLTKLPGTSLKCEFVLDSNVVLNLRNLSRDGKRLPPCYWELLVGTRAHLHKYWSIRRKLSRHALHIAVDVSLAAYELTKQDVEIDEHRYVSFLEDFYRNHYPEQPMASGWHKARHKDLTKFVNSMLPTLQAVIIKILQLMPDGKLSEKIIANAVTELINWLLEHRRVHTVTCGTLIHEGILAFAGNERARELLKIKDIKKLGIQKTAHNVAWDFVFLHYHALTTATRQTSRVVFCTADGALASLMSVPQSDYNGSVQEISQLASDSTLELPAFIRALDSKRLSVGTALREDIVIKVNSYFDAPTGENLDVPATAHVS